ncbi:MAG: hypothetical protein AAFY38_00180 [Pseudomonadota bacterium]
MSKLHDPQNPRHARLFELLRQQNRAETTVSRGKGFVIRRVTPQEADAIKAAARHSLQAP